jgi:hypothetical protein
MNLPESLARERCRSYGGPGGAVQAMAGPDSPGSALCRAARIFIEPARKPARLAAGPIKAQEHTQSAGDLS